MSNSGFWDVVIRSIAEKKVKGYTWEQIAQDINYEYGKNYDESTYRKKYNQIEKEEDSPLQDNTYLELSKLRVKVRDERTQTNANIRRLSREETIKEIAFDFARQMESKKILEIPEPEENTTLDLDGGWALLNIGDWHYGLNIENSWNVYNVEVARKRIVKMMTEVRDDCWRHNVKHLVINGLGDYISGNIHLPLRINSQEDVIGQTMEVSEIMAEMINTLSQYFYIDFYTVYGNHGRVTPNKKESIDLENFERIIEWYISRRLQDNPRVTIHMTEDGFGDMVAYDVKNWHVGLIHGDKDNVTKAVSNMTLMTRKPFDLVVTAHKHHLSADETNGCIVIANPSMMGVDDYAKDLRATSYPAQTLIIVGDKSPVECMYYIRLD